jgi:hypothetical protein
MRAGVFLGYRDSGRALGHQMVDGNRQRIVAATSLSEALNVNRSVVMLDIDNVVGASVGRVVRTFGRNVI